MDSLVIARRAASAAVVVVACGSAPPSAGAAPESGAPLTVCMYPGFAPFVSAGGDADNITDWTGWDVDFLTKFAATQGRSLVPAPS